MPRLLVVHHTPSPALEAMFEAATSGARTDEIEGIEVVIRPALTAAAVDVLEADGYLLGTLVQLALVPLWRICTATGMTDGCVHGREGYVTTDSAPTMVGFVWSPRPGFVPTEPGENGWCSRDAICHLFGWKRDSEECKRFIEAPAPEDTPRLAEHLGLAVLQIPQDWNELVSRLAHPGAAIFDFHSYQKSHSVYVHDLRWLLHHWPAIDGLPATSADRPLWHFGWPLGHEHMVRGPVLGALLIDERQPPRTL